MEAGSRSGCILQRHTGCARASAKERPAAEGGCRRCIKCTLPVKRQIEKSVKKKRAVRD